MPATCDYVPIRPKHDSSLNRNYGYSGAEVAPSSSETINLTAHHIRAMTVKTDDFLVGKRVCESCLATGGGAPKCVDEAT